jgi:S-adenosylmethionine-diacylglycerol 3-amino-3-carboxypropyl transferase
VVLTSAGCNTLDYLLDGPAEVYAVDVNPRQNALLELKLALITHGRFEDLLAFFGQGWHPEPARAYAGVRRWLSPGAASFWDARIHYFERGGRKGSFYYHGTSGTVAWVLTRHLLDPRRGLRGHLLDLVEARDLEEQREIYARIEPRLWGRLITWLLRHPLLMSMLGVPRAQLRLIHEGHPGGINGFVADKLRHVLTEVAIRDNYFWRVYLTGSYTRDCCPNYLLEENFETLRERAGRVQVHDTTVSEFLRRSPGHYTHFVLLDHQDWLAWHKPAALAEEWRLLLDNSAAGSKVLMRSASPRVGFLPEWVLTAVRFFPELTEALHPKDRVGTYGSVNLAVVR